MRTCGVAEGARGRDVQVRAVVSLRTEAVFGVFFALALVAEVEGMGEFAGVAFFAEAALVVFADQVADARAVFFGDVVPVWAGGTAGAAVLLEVGADGSVCFGGAAEGWEAGFEEVVEGEDGWGLGWGLEDLGG